MAVFSTTLLTKQKKLKYALTKVSEGSRENRLPFSMPTGRKERPFMTKPREKTREELTAEIEDGKKKIRQYENREKMLRQKLSKEERRTRSHRLIVLMLSILVYTFFTRMFDLMLPLVVKHSIVAA